MNRVLAGAGLASPAAHYAHAILSEGADGAALRMLHTSGIVPVAPDGTVPPGIEAQAVVVWSNIVRLLGEAGMVLADVVSVTTYVVVDHLDSLGAVMAARDRYLDGHLAASTLVTVPRLARADWLMEIAVVAAQ